MTSVLRAETQRKRKEEGGFSKMRRCVGIAGISVFIAVSSACARSSESAQAVPDCSGDVASESIGLRSTEGRFATPEAAIKDHASKSFKEKGKAYDKLEKKSDKRYEAKKDGQLVALYDVIKMPDGGYEVSGAIACSTDIVEDSDQP
jgi:hypothetical protein